MWQRWSLHLWHKIRQAGVVDNNVSTWYLDSQRRASLVFDRVKS